QTQKNISTSIIDRLDQTSLRVCAQLLDCMEIIQFGRTCHSTYATLNHPLTFKYVFPRSNLISWLVRPVTHPFFLQYMPIIWRLNEDQKAGKYMTVVSGVPPHQFRLIGLYVVPTVDVDKNIAISDVVI